MKILIYSLLINNLLILYFYSFFQTASKIFKFELNIKSKIILGYSFNILLIFFIYFLLKLENIFLYYILFFLSILLFINIRDYFKYFFFKKINLFLNLVIIIILVPALVYGEQFYIFRGNYWDSSHYLNSALLFKDFSYNEILKLENPLIFTELSTMKVVVTGRPIVNYILSIFLNLNFSIFYTYYLLKVLITTLIFISFINLIKNLVNTDNLKIYFVSLAFVFSFFNFYIFEIDALSHYASIPILLLVVKFIFQMFNKLNENKNYYLLSILLPSLFIIYPEIIIVPTMLFLILFLDNYKMLNKKNIIKFIILFIFCLILTLPSYTMTYKFLFSHQLSQSTRQSDWWGYYGSFILGRDNLVLNFEFVDQLKSYISQNANMFDIIKLIHVEHFQNKYYFIYFNIFPSLAGLYYLGLGKIENNFNFVFQIIIILGIYIYLIKIIIKNITFIFSEYKIKKKFLYMVLLLLFFISYFFIIGSYWTIIKFYTYLFPFIFIFFALDLKLKKFNSVYIILISIFFVYKFSSYNSGIGRYDSFPSIINPILKKNIIWNYDYEELKGCRKISFKDDNYIIKTYLNLKRINLDLNNKYSNYDGKNCKVNLNNKKFDIVYE